MLAEIYGWVTEAFDTADLKDAKAPLDQLNAQSVRSALADYLQSRHQSNLQIFSLAAARVSGGQSIAIARG
jgi:hypothetical protein